MKILTNKETQQIVGGYVCHCYDKTIIENYNLIISTTTDSAPSMSCCWICCSSLKTNYWTVEKAGVIEKPNTCEGYEKIGWAI
jgi:bacteriocin-like protein